MSIPLLTKLHSSIKSVVTMVKKAEMTQTVRSRLVRGITGSGVVHRLLPLFITVLVFDEA